MTLVEQAWLEAVAEVRGLSRGEVVRQAISSYCVRETARIQRTRHYAVIGYLARQEDWNPVDDHLSAVADRDEVPGSMQNAYKRAEKRLGRVERVLADDLLYIGPERREDPRADPAPQSWYLDSPRTDGKAAAAGRPSPPPAD